MPNEKILYAVLNWNRQLSTELLQQLPGDILVCTNKMERFKTNMFVKAIEAHPKISTSKNRVLKYAIQNNYDWCFIIEDDVKIIDNSCFKKYLELASIYKVPLVSAGYISQTLVPGISNYVNENPNPVFNIHLPNEIDNVMVNRYLGSSFMLFKIAQNMIKFDEQLSCLETNYLIVDMVNSSKYPFNGYFLDIANSWKYLAREDVKRERVVTEPLLQLDFKIRGQKKIEHDANATKVLNHIRDCHIAWKRTVKTFEKG